MVNNITQYHMSEQFYLCLYVSPNVRSFVPGVLKLKLSSEVAIKNQDIQVTIQCLQ